MAVKPLQAPQGEGHHFALLFIEAWVIHMAIPAEIDLHIVIDRAARPDRVTITQGLVVDTVVICIEPFLTHQVGQAVNPVLSCQRYVTNSGNVDFAFLEHIDLLLGACFGFGRWVQCPSHAGTPATDRVSICYLWHPYGIQPCGILRFYQFAQSA